MNNLITEEKIYHFPIDPIKVFEKVRKLFSEAMFFEKFNSLNPSFPEIIIAFNPIWEYRVINNELTIKSKGIDIKKKIRNEEAIGILKKQIEIIKEKSSNSHNGLIGYISFDSVKYFDKVSTIIPTDPEREIPEILYKLYQTIIIYNSELKKVTLLKNSVDHYMNSDNKVDLESMIFNANNFKNEYNFKVTGEETSNFNDQEFLDIILKGKSHCDRGDVFQIVLSRIFHQKYEGDDFAVFLNLRKINPSPYSFYFQYNSYKIFGTSPESQLIVQNNKATVFPIAGTYRKTGIKKKDEELGQKLLRDPKENSEHVMLVDLARNDLSKKGNEVRVEKFKEVNFFSHVIHLVSKVTAQIPFSESSLNIMADTFPAGTLSGAPKNMAVNLIYKYEKTQRSFYGGAIGFLQFNGNLNMAIIIRSVLCKNGKMFYQAGAGIVASSEIANELEEVNNKLMAIRKAIEKTEVKLYENINSR